MSELNTAPAGAQPASNAAPTQESQPAAAQETKKDIASDPTESYSDFLKRLEKETGKPQAVKKEEPKIRSLEDLEKASTAKEGSKEIAPKEEEAVATEEQPTVEQQIEQQLKIKDKEYKVSDLEKILEEHEKFSGSVKNYETQFKEIESNLQKLFKSFQESPDALDSLQIPEAVLRDYYYKKYIEPTIELTPEQKAAEYDRMRQQQAEVAKQTQEQQAKQAEEARLHQLQNHYQTQWTQQIQQIMQTGDLPQTEFVAQRLAGYMKQAMDKGLYHLTGPDFVKVVKEDINTMQEQLLKTMSPEQIKNLLGEDGFKKLRANEIQHLESTKKAAPKTIQKEEQQQSTRRYTSPYDFIK